MEELKEKNKKLITCGIVLLIIILLVGGYCSARWLFAKDKQKKDDNNEVFVTDVTDYDINLIKEINKLEKDNYLISPYSIEMALSMLRDGASGKTREEIESLIGNNILSYKGQYRIDYMYNLRHKEQDSVFECFLQSF